MDSVQPRQPQEQLEKLLLTLLLNDHDAAGNMAKGELVSSGRWQGQDCFFVAGL